MLICTTLGLFARKLYAVDKKDNVSKTCSLHLVQSMAIGPAQEEEKGYLPF